MKVVIFQEEIAVKTFILPMLIVLLSLPGLAFAGEPATISIKIANESLGAKYIEVKDEVCEGQVSMECKLAQYLIDSDECRKNPYDEKCVEAGDTVKGASCVEGIVYYGELQRDEVIAVTICTNPTGNGKVAIRNSPTAPWVHYNWIKAGDKIVPR